MMPTVRTGNASVKVKVFSNVNFFKKNFGDISPFCGATDTPVLDF